MIGDAHEVAHRRGLFHVGELVLQLLDPTLLTLQVVLGELWGVQQVVDELRVELVGDLLEPTPGQVGLDVGGHPHAQAELGVVLEQGVRPCRATALGVLAPRGRRQVTAVDGGTAGGVGHLGAVAEELGDELDVRRLATTRAGSGELEERL